jgi:murein DD-endopeptidase MepM/ murein hydrolase activator NlpD
MRWLISLAAFVASAAFLIADDAASVRLADGFQLPVGTNGDGKGYYRARGMTPNGHLGEDWDGVGGGDTDLGDPVTATAHGIVLFARDFHLGWGNVIILRHAYLEAGQVTYLDSLYGHLNEILVHEGDQVMRGQKIGTIGNNHGMYSAHLHFEMRKNLRIGMARSAFARDYTNYWDPSAFVALHPRLDGGNRIASVPINTFVKYTGPSDLESAIAEAGGAQPAPSRPTPLARISPITPITPTARTASSSVIAPQATPKPRGVFKVDPFEDMRGVRY